VVVLVVKLITLTTILCKQNTKRVVSYEVYFDA
jgi:hypothetical protein